MRTLRSNTRELAEQQQCEELSGCIAYYANDLTIITWNAALVFGPDMEDVLTVPGTGQRPIAGTALSGRSVGWQPTGHVRDECVVGECEGTHAAYRRVNARRASIQRGGDQCLQAVPANVFLGRVYAQASQSLGMSHFDHSVKDKLNLLNTLYTTLSDEACPRPIRYDWNGS